MLKRLENGEIYFGEAKWTPFGTIDCSVMVEETDEIIRFTASPDDSVDHGRELFQMLSTTYADQVTQCTEEERYTTAESDVKSERLTLLRRTDWTQLPDVPEATRTLWVDYRQQLRDITEQDGYPYNVSWPTPPS